MERNTETPSQVLPRKDGRVGGTSFTEGPQKNMEWGVKESSARIHLNFLLLTSEMITLSGFILINKHAGTFIPLLHKAAVTW